MAGAVVGCDGEVREGGGGGVLVVEVEDARGGLLEELAAAVAKEFVEADLHFEGDVAVGAVDGLVSAENKGDRFVWGFGVEHVAKGNVFEADILADVVVVWDVDLVKLVRVCLWKWSGSLLLGSPSRQRRVLLEM